MSDFRKSAAPKARVDGAVPKATQERRLQSLGRTSQHLQGADGRYSDNDSLRSYYK